MKEEEKKDHEPFIMTERSRRGAVPADNLEGWKDTLKVEGFTDDEIDAFLRSNSSEYDRAHPPPVDEFIETETSRIETLLQVRQGPEKRMSEHARAYVRKYLLERYEAVYGK